MKSFERNIQARGFIISKRVSCYDRVLYVDNENKMWTMMGSSLKKARRFSFNQIISFELIDNTETTISGRGGSSLLGGLIAGPVGAMIGASGSRKQTEHLVAITLNVTINDIDTPNVTLVFVGNEMREKANRAFGLFSFMKGNN